MAKDVVLIVKIANPISTSREIKEYIEEMLSRIDCNIVKVTII
jgi:hypothetical protein